VSYEKNNRDGNERSILKVFEAAGWFMQQMNRFQGHDYNGYGHGVTLGQMFDLEFKKPGEKLTPREEQFARDLGRVSRRLWVLQSDVEAEWLVNAEYERIPDRTHYLFEDAARIVYPTRREGIVRQ
jgi:hypothetical protein